MNCTEMWSKTQFSPAQSMDSKQQGIVVANKDGVANNALYIPVMSSAPSACEGGDDVQVTKKLGIVQGPQRSSHP
jgi:hypothetical protein